MNNHHRSLALVALAAIASGCITRRIDAKTYEIQGIAMFVEGRANRICGEDVDGRVEMLSYDPGGTTTGEVTSSRTTTGSCDRSGTCLSTTSTSSIPVTWEREPRKTVRVTCP